LTEAKSARPLTMWEQVLRTYPLVKGNASGVPAESSWLRTTRLLRWLVAGGRLLQLVVNSFSINKRGGSMKFPPEQISAGQCSPLVDQFCVKPFILTAWSWRRETSLLNVVVQAPPCD